MICGQIVQGSIAPSCRPTHEFDSARNGIRTVCISHQLISYSVRKVPYINRSGEMPSDASAGDEAMSAGTDWHGGP